LENVISLVLIAIVIFVIHRYQAESKKKELRLQRYAESRRLAECEEVVRYFANYHGYIARAVVSKEELEDLILNGATALELEDFITERMLTVDGLTLGYQKEENYKIPVILPQEFRDKHIYVIGKSGYGKTNFLRYLISQDLQSNVGIAVLAPEYEMLHDELLPFIPENRIPDVIYFNPADHECPVVLNPLHIDKDDDIDLHVDETFTILQRVVGEGGQRMDEILRHALYALIERPNTDLLDIAPLLDRHDDTFRREIIATTNDEQTRYFFERTYNQLPKDAHIPILNRIGRIVRAKNVRNCLCPPKNTTLDEQDVSNRILNIRRAMDEGKILLFNLSDGILGNIASQLIGQFIVSKFQTATMSRADLSKKNRNPFYLYLDEFQNFCGIASKSYEKILSRARKYKLGMILAHQQTGQLSSDLLREILGNVSTLVSFQVSQADASKLAKEFISQYDYDIAPLPTEELLRLNIGEAYCKIGKSAFPFYVPKMSDSSSSERGAEVIKASREQYGIPRLTETKESDHDYSNDDSDDPLADLDPEGVFE